MISDRAPRGAVEPVRIPGGPLLEAMIDQVLADTKTCPK
ncbi:hypothetical protein [Alloactinosynnema sp. L-07]|nr:hypothetical protein [Alloactinosynnema sp. L-07]